MAKPKSEKAILRAHLKEEEERQNRTETRIGLINDNITKLRNRIADLQRKREILTDMNSDSYDRWHRYFGRLETLNRKDK